MSKLVPIALCPSDNHEMRLQHAGLDLEAWYCDSCGEIRTIVRADGPVPEAPLDSLRAGNVQWIQKEMPAIHGRITDMEGG